jgi:NADH-quinone oxidoreductase subunit M
MIAILLIVIPLIGGLLLFAFKSDNAAKTFAFFSTLCTLAVSLLGLTLLNKPNLLAYDAEWMPAMGSRFHVGLDGMGQLMCLLTAISFTIILLSISNNKYKNAPRFYALMLLTQAGLMGVFLSLDLLLFYFFWELALIPVYFLSSQWGGEKRIAATFKFFIYTFLGSLLMLIGVLYVYFKAGNSFDISAIYNLSPLGKSEQWLFWLFFIAFAIKMPIFPFHTWQPDAYEQSATPVTMVLSGIMVKMGVFALIRWLAPMMPAGTYIWGDTVALLAIVGMIYASIIAIRQDDLKRLIAYSSIAHIGLMCVAVFALNTIAWQGVLFQMFVHGINIIGLWIVADVIEQRYGTKKISELGGIATTSPTLTIFLVVIALANIALPLTNAFVGEWMMFYGIFSSTITSYGIVQTIAAASCIILAAVYTLNMIKKIFYGPTVTVTQTVQTTSVEVKVALSIVVVLIVIMGIYPKPVLALTNETVSSLLTHISHALNKKLF